MDTMRFVLDAVQIFRGDIDEMLQQQRSLCVQHVHRILALTDVAASQSLTSARKKSTRKFEISGTQTSFEENGSEPRLSGPGIRGGARADSSKCLGRCRRKPLVDKNGLHHSCLSGSFIGASKANDQVKTIQKQVTEHVCHLKEEQRGLARAGKAPLRTAEIHDHVSAPILTRSRAKMLGCSRGTSTVESEGPPPKKTRRRGWDPTAICSAVVSAAVGKCENSFNVSSPGCLDRGSQRELPAQREHVSARDDTETRGGRLVAEDSCRNSGENKVIVRTSADIGCKFVSVVGKGVSPVHLHSVPKKRVEVLDDEVENDTVCKDEDLECKATVLVAVDQYEQMDRISRFLTSERDENAGDILHLKAEECDDGGRSQRVRTSSARGHSVEKKIETQGDATGAQVHVLQDSAQKRARNKSVDARQRTPLLDSTLLKGEGETVAGMFGAFNVIEYSAPVKEHVRNKTLETAESSSVAFGRICSRISPNTGDVVDVSTPETRHRSDIKENESVMPLASRENFLEKNREAAILTSSDEFATSSSLTVKQGGNERAETPHLIPLEANGSLRDKLQKRCLSTFVGKPGCKENNFAALKRLKSDSAETQQGMAVESDKSSLRKAKSVNIMMDATTADSGEIVSSKVELDRRDSEGQRPRILNSKDEFQGRSLCCTPDGHVVRTVQGVRAESGHENLGRSTASPQTPSNELAVDEISVPVVLHLKAEESMLTTRTLPERHSSERCLRTESRNHEAVCCKPEQIASQAEKGQVTRSNYFEVDFSVGEHGNEAEGLEYGPWDISHSMGKQALSGNDSLIAVGENALQSTMLNSCEERLLDEASGKEMWVKSPAKATSGLMQRTPAIQIRGRIHHNTVGEDVASMPIFNVGKVKENEIVKSMDARIVQSRTHQIHDGNSQSSRASETGDEILPQLRCTSQIEVDDNLGTSQWMHNPCVRLTAFSGLSASQMLARVVDGSMANASHPGQGGGSIRKVKSSLQGHAGSQNISTCDVSSATLAIHLATIGSSQAIMDTLSPLQAERNEETILLTAGKMSFQHASPLGDWKKLDELRRALSGREDSTYGDLSSAKSRPHTDHYFETIKPYKGGAPPHLERMAVEATYAAGDEAEVRKASAPEWTPQQDHQKTPFASKDRNTGNPSATPAEGCHHQDAVSVFHSPQIVQNCLRVVHNVCRISELQGLKPIDKTPSQEKFKTIKPSCGSNVEHVPADCVRVTDGRNGAAAIDRVVTPDRKIGIFQKGVCSNLNAQGHSSNLVAAAKTFVPVIKRPPPSYMPTRKREVKVKALLAAQALRCRQVKMSKKEMPKELSRLLKENSRLALEAAETSAIHRHPVEVITRSADSTPSIDKSSTSDCFNSKRLLASVKKVQRTNALKLRVEKKLEMFEEVRKKKEEELKRKEAKYLAWKQNKEQLERQKKRQRRENMVKPRRAEEGQSRGGQMRLGMEDKEEQRNEEDSEGVQRLKAAAETSSLYSAKERWTSQPLLKPKFGGEILQISNHQGSGQQVQDLNGKISLPCRPSRLRPGRVPVLPPDRRSNSAAGLPAPTDSNRVQRPSSTSSRLVSGDAGLVASCDPAKVSSQLQGGSLDVKNRRDCGVSCFELLNTFPASIGGDLGPVSYDMSPYRGSSDEEDDTLSKTAKKFIPFWARKENLMPQLLRQLSLDPDDIFAGSKTCSLKEVFGTTGSKKVQDFGKRSDSGDWVKDRVSWKEELKYKVAMGYMPTNKY